MDVVSLPLIPKRQCRLEKLSLYLANKNELGLSMGGRVAAVKRNHVMEGRDSAMAQSQGLLRGMAKSRVCAEKE